MARTLVIRDPKHPDFPHGEPKGRERGCGCTPCRTAKAKQKKRAKLLHARYGNIKHVTPERQAQVVRHIDRLLEAVPGASRTAVCRAAGVSHCVLKGLDGARNIAPASAKALLDLTPDDVAKVVGMRPKQESVHFARTMQALGYPLLWQSRQTGVSMIDLVRDHRAYTTIGKAKKIEELARRVGDVPATPESTGTTQRAITKAKSTAQRNGFYPPMCYDENGVLDWRAIPGHRWANADEKAHRRIALLRAYLFNPEGLSIPQVAAVVGENPEEVNRLIKRFKLQQSESRRPKRVAWLTEQIHRFDFEATDPVLFSLNINLLDPHNLPQDHPGVVAWRDEHPEWQRGGVTNLHQGTAAGAPQPSEQVAA